MLGQTVPSTGSSNREGLMTDGGQCKGFSVTGFYNVAVSFTSFNSQDNADSVEAGKTELP